jgi:ABC-type transport system substrate-binding protein
MFRLLLLTSLLALSGCDDSAWNNPYPSHSATANILYTAFTSQPEHLDPAISYDQVEWQFISQIYEPILQYSYLLRPYTLEPATAAQMPQVSYDAATNITTYKITIKPSIMYQPHPALARNENGEYYYHDLTYKQAKSYKDIADFKYRGCRELLSADYVNQIKRLADPRLNSPVFGFLSPYIIGMSELREQLVTAYASRPKNKALDLRSFELKGVKVVDDYNYEIKINGKYAQFIYWLEMLFFAPVPWEATVFYSQPGMEEHNLSLDTYPIGTGAYYLTENNPQRRMILLKNPNFHDEYYPSVGMPSDAILLSNAGKKLPFIDQIVFSLEKESVPYWDKFMQGYYDRSGIGTDNFNSALGGSGSNGIHLSQSLQEKGVKLLVSSQPAVWYWGFNMLDDVVGGYSERACNLRKAIGLAFDVDGYNVIFYNDRGILANGPIPPGILGYQEYIPSIDPSTKLAAAKRLLADAGYPGGRETATGKQLQIYFDTTTSGEPDEKSYFGWLQKQFEKLGINLVIRATDANRYSEKIRNGTQQMFFYGWHADYPDPENFLFLFYGPNSKVHDDSINLTNYNNEKFNVLFEKMKAMGDSPTRQKLINEMVAILQDDYPWVWGFFPQSFVLSNPWNTPGKPSGVALNTVKYAKLDPVLRNKLRLEWNRPLIWPVFAVVAIVILLIAPAIIGYITSTRATARRFK